MCSLDFFFTLVNHTLLRLSDSENVKAAVYVCCRGTFSLIVIGYVIMGPQDLCFMSTLLNVYIRKINIVGVPR